MAQTISKNGINLIKDEEDFSSKAYRDANSSNGHLICFGNRYHPNGKLVKAGDRVTFSENSEEATRYITAHLEKNVYPLIYKAIRVPLAQSQFDAICDLVYNLGRVPDILSKAINSGNTPGIRAAFYKYNTIKGVYNKTLDKRRKRDYNMYQMGGSLINTTSIGTSTQLDIKSAAKLTNDYKNNSKVTFSRPKDIKHINPTLINDLHKASRISGFSIYVGSAYTGRENSKTTSGNVSRHTKGYAVDIPMINGISKASNVIKFTQLAESLARVFESMGYTRNKESGNPRAVLFGFNKKSMGGDHTNHVHVSCTTSSESVTPSIPDSQGYQAEDTPEVQPPPPPPPYTYLANVSDSIDTLQKFIDIYKIKMTPQELLEYEDNKNEIFNAYTATQKVQYKQASVDCISGNTKLAVPWDKFTSRSIYSINQNLTENTNISAFIEAGIKSLLNNPNYKKVQNNSNSQELREDDIFKRYEQCQIWIWSRAIDDSGVNFFDATVFVQTINTNVNKNGGNFTISFPHLTFNGDLENLSNIKLDDLFLKLGGSSNFLHKNANDSIATYDTSSSSAKFIDDNDEFKNSGYQYFKRNQSFFQSILQNNDLVFIRLEKIGSDIISPNESKDIGDFNINSKELSGQTLDMIGLIDSVDKSISSKDNQISLTIQGRDLSKLVFDDGVYFFDLEYCVADREQIIKNSSKTKIGNRLIIDAQNTNKDTYENNIRKNVGTFMGDTSFNFDKTQSIEEWLTFIFSQLTNIDIAPDALFNGYPDKTMIITRQQDEAGVSQYKQVPANGVWQAVKLAIDPEIGDRRIADSSLATATGSLINLIRKVAQEPFIEFSMDTYGDRYYFIVRKPPFSQQAFKSNFCINIFEQDVYTENLQFTNEIYTWYKLNPTGSIIDSTAGQSLAFFPAVMLPEYMEVWGSKVLDVATQYLDFDMSQSDQTQSNLDKIKAQGQQDLDWLIETTAYLPFTQEGTITIKSDRRIKRGMNIRYLPTGEIYHVDGVSHNKSFTNTIQQSTTLHVSRGMVEKHIDKYFQVVNLLRNQKNAGTWDKDTWTVNQDVFKFFLHRRQFMNNNG